MDTNIENFMWVYSEGWLHASTENPIDSKIRSFAYLQKGWHYGDGCPSSPGIVSASLRVLACLRRVGLNDVDAFAGDSGEISLSAIWGEHVVDAIVEIDGSISVVYEKNGVQQSNDAHLPETKAYTRIVEIAGGIWKLSAGFTGIGLIKGRIALTELLFGTPESTAGYQSPNVIVYIGSATQPAAKYVSMHEKHTSNEAFVPLAIPPFIGNLIPQSYRKEIR